MKNELNLGSNQAANELFHYIFEKFVSPSTQQMVKEKVVLTKTNKV